MRWLVAIAALLLVVGAAACGLSEAEENYNRGVELSGEERWEEAIVEYDKAIELDPDLFEAYSNRGLAYAQLGDLEQALVDLDEAIKLGSDIWQPYFVRGLLHVDLGNVQQAIDDLENALPLVDDSAIRAEIEATLDQLRGQ